MGNEPVLYYIEGSHLFLIVKYFVMATFKPLKVNKMSNTETKCTYHRVEKSSLVGKKLIGFSVLSIIIMMTGLLASK